MYDLQLDEEMEPEESYSIRGFVRQHTKSDFSAPGAYTWGENGLSITPVSAAYKARQQMIAEGGNELNSGDQASEDSDNDDGAIQSFAVSASAALATLYALTI